MDTVLRFLNSRSLAAAGAILVAAVLAFRLRDVPRQWADARAVAASRGAAAAPDIMSDVNARESARLRGLYRLVVSELDAAASRGVDVRRQRALADAALGLDTPAYRATAVERLNQLRLAIPKPREDFGPAGPDDGASAPLASPTPRPGPARR